MDKRFVIGEKVVWTSQSSGFVTTKHGVIVGIVPVRVTPAYRAGYGIQLNSCIAIVCGKKPYGLSRLGRGLSRRYESYLVAVGNQLYWPWVKHLYLDRATPA